MSDTEDSREKTELDEALEMTDVDWRYIKHIVSEQSWVVGVYNCLERLLRVPRVPPDLIRFIFEHMEEVPGDNSVSVIDMMRSVNDIWYNVLVDRESGAAEVFRLSHHEPFEATEEYTSELVAITNGTLLYSNEVFFDAFQVTKLVVVTLFARGLQGYETTNKTLSFANLVIELKLPPMLLWLAVAEDPNCLRSFQSNGGSLPLHRAFSTLKFAAGRRHFLIRFPTEHLTDRVKEVAHAQLVDLFNRATAVQLLCHLCPEACRIAAVTALSTSVRDERLPLDSFLYSIHLEENSWRFPGDDKHWYKMHPYQISQQELLEDIHAVISNAPMALETRQRDTGLYPFCLPLLQVTKRESHPHEIYKRESFSLTLAYELLRSNPTVLTRHLTVKDDSFLEPAAHHGKNLKHLLQSERSNFQEMESLKRDITALRKEVETLKQRVISVSRPPKRRQVYDDWLGI
jgi:hypothetical protein